MKHIKELIFTCIVCKKPCVGDSICENCKQDIKNEILQK